MKLSNRRGGLLIQMITAVGVSGVILGTVVPLVLEARRQADWGIAKARLTVVGREISSRLESDARSAVQAEASGAHLLLTVARMAGPSDQVSYSFRRAVLTRERLRSGRVLERQQWGAPLRAIRFWAEGRRVGARMDLVRALRGRELSLPLEVTAERRADE